MGNAARRSALGRFSAEFDTPWSKVCTDRMNKSAVVLLLTAELSPASEVAESVTAVWCETESALFLLAELSFAAAAGPLEDEDVVASASLSL